MQKLFLILPLALLLLASCDKASTKATITQSTPVATQAPMATPTPQAIHYPPITEADLSWLAVQGDASAIHEFHSESVGLIGVCSQPKQEVTVDPALSGQHLAEDLLAYFYAQHLDNPCGSLLLAYYNQTEAISAYTAGRIDFDVTDSSSTANVNPSASNLKHKLTLNIGGFDTTQQYIVTF